MRVAAGFMLIVWGTAGFAGGLVDLLLWWSPVTPWKVVILALLVTIVSGGISAIRKRRYWWAFSAAIGLVIVGIISGTWQYVWFETPVVGRLLMAVRSWAIWGIPGLLALVFLIRRKGQFGASPNG